MLLLPNLKICQPEIDASIGVSEKDIPARCHPESSIIRVISLVTTLEICSNFSRISSLRSSSPKYKTSIGNSQPSCRMLGITVKSNLAWSSPAVKTIPRPPEEKLACKDIWSG